MIRIEFTLRVGRERPELERPEMPDVYDTAPALVERDPSLDTETDPEMRHRPRVGFQAKEADR